MTSFTVDLKDLAGQVYTGRDRGEAFRRQIRLAEREKEVDSVEVLVPDETYTISSSFFLGLLGPSVVQAGSKAAFYKRYTFRTPDFLKSVIDEYVARALQSRELFH
jgi:hypothetical protein